MYLILIIIVIFSNLPTIDTPATYHAAAKSIAPRAVWYTVTGPIRTGKTPAQEAQIQAQIE